LKHEVSLKKESLFMEDTQEEQRTNSGLQSLFGEETAGGTVSLENIRARAKRELTAFGVLAQEGLAAAGINCPPALGLAETPQHEIVLDNEHPQREAIAQWLSGNVALAKKFKEVEVLFEIVRAAENAGVTFPPESRFHIGLTSVGPVAYFQDRPGDPPGA
jgi:phage I-like protein